MKKILSVLILLFTLVACETATEQVTISKDEYNSMRNN
jgi:hypothetical protein